MQIQMARHVRFELGRRDLQWSPSHFEVSFGDEVGTEPDPLSCLEPFSLDTPTGPVLFAGRIDRIDQQERSMRIIDYKSTVTVSQGDVADGTAIQLAVYALALEQLLMPGMVCAEAAFVQVGGKTWLEVLKRKGGVWEARRDAAMAQTACAVVGIREGQFPPVPRGSTCQYCDVRQACRYSAGRIGRREEEMEDA